MNITIPQEIESEQIFAGLATSEDFQPALSQEAQEHEARLLAVANAKSLDDNGAFFEELQSLVRSYSDAVALQQNLNMRRQMASERRIRDFNRFSELSADPLVPEDLRRNLQSLAEASLLESREQMEKTIAERTAVEKLRMLIENDPTQAAVYATNLKTPSVEAAYQQTATKILLLQGAVSKIASRMENQSVVADVFDFVFGVAQELVPYGQRIGVVETANKRWYDFLWKTGRRRADEIGTLWNLSLEEFKNVLDSKFAESVFSNSTILGYTNNTHATSLANSFLGFSEFDRKFESANSLIAAATVPGLYTALKIMRNGTFGLMSAMGGRKQARDAVAFAAANMTKAGPAEIKAVTGMPQEQVLSAVSVHAADTNGFLNPGVSFSGYVAQIRDRAEALSKWVAKIRPQHSPRLQQEELEKAITDAIETIETRLKSKPLDIDVKEIPLAGGGTVQRVVAIFGKPDGLGFATKEEAEAYASALGYVGAAGVKRTPDSLYIHLTSGVRPDPDGVFARIGSRPTMTSERALVADSVPTEPVVRPAQNAVQDISGQWFARIEVDVAEDGFRTNPLNLPEYTVAGRYLSSARGLSDRDLGDMASVAAATKNEILSTFKELFKPFQALSNKERFYFQEVLRKGIIDSVWYTDDQFLDLYRAAHSGKRVTGEAKALEAYHAYRDANDLEWMLRNDAVYQNYVGRGFSTVMFTNDRVGIPWVNAKVYDNFQKIPERAELRVYDVSEDIHYTESNKLTDIKSLREQGYVLIETEFAQKLQDGTYVQFFLAKPGSFLQIPLDRVQIGYAEGGHRMYQDKYFVKIAHRVTQADTGKQLFLSPHTMITAPTAAAARKWADTMNQALEAVAKGASEHEISTIFNMAGGRGFPTAQEFIDDFRKGLYDPEFRFEVLFDRELPSQYKTAGVDFRQFLSDDVTNNASAGLLRTQGRMFYSGKGEEALKNHMGETAAIVDPYDAMAQSMQNVASLVGFADYRVNAVERWFNTFKDFLDFRRLAGTSPMEVFMHAPVSSEVPRKLRLAIEAQRDVIKRTLRFQTPYERAINEMGRQFSEWVFRKSDELGLATETAEKLSRAAYSSVVEKSLIGSLRSVVFDLKLGLFNFAQLPLQISTAMAAATIGGASASSKALRTYLPLRMLLRETAKANGDPQKLIDEMVAKIDQKPGSFGFQSSEEARAFFETAFRSGRFKITAEDTLVANYSSSAAYGDFGQFFNSIREKGRFFFNESEKLNQLFAYRLAWEETKTKFPDLMPGTAEFTTKVLGRTEDYSFRMLRESQAWWQNNSLASIPTQFWAYPFRMMEAMGVFGLSRSAFDAKQITRLVIGQVLFYGVAGIPFIQLIFDEMMKNSGETPDIGTKRGVIYRGIIDNIIYAATGADVQFGKRQASANFANEIIHDFFGWGAFGPTTPAEITGGAALSILGNIGTTLYKIVKWQYNMSGNNQDIDVADFDLHMNFFREISTVNNLMNGYYAYQYGRLISRSGTRLVGNVSPTEAAFIAFGIRPGSEDKIRLHKAYLENREEKIAAAAKVVIDLQTQWIEDPSKYEENSKKLQVFMAMQPAQWRNEIRRRARAAVNKEMLQGLEERVAKDIREREMLTNGQP